MAKFLDTTGISYHLEQTIKNADERLVLISPFLRINDRIKEQLEDKDLLKIDIRVIYGKNELQPEEKNWLKSKNSIRTSFCKNLHAKCYMNEKEALITSMNLYEFSQTNNNEMGIHITRDDDEQLYSDIDTEVKRLIRISEEIKVSVEKVVQTDKGQSKKIKDTKGQGEGHCISCNKSIKLDPLVPYCKECYKIWKKDEDEEYQENYCHICGKDEATTKKKPTCYSCYKTNKNKLEFNV
ncbi:hypothetical protein ES708_03796 [subsurface metagenome]